MGRLNSAPPERRTRLRNVLGLARWRCSRWRPDRESGSAFSSNRGSRGPHWFTRSQPRRSGRVRNRNARICPADIPGSSEADVLAGLTLDTVFGEIDLTDPSLQGAFLACSALLPEREAPKFLGSSRAVSGLSSTAQWGCPQAFHMVNHIKPTRFTVLLLTGNLAHSRSHGQPTALQRPNRASFAQPSASLDAAPTRSLVARTHRVAHHAGVQGESQPVARGPIARNRADVGG